jgi:hypothetical protein
MFSGLSMTPIDPDTTSERENFLAMNGLGAFFRDRKNLSILLVVLFLKVVKSFHAKLAHRSISL